ncbi:hypothetical protein [Streptomyces fractus]
MRHHHGLRTSDALRAATALRGLAIGLARSMGWNDVVAATDSY